MSFLLKLFSIITIFLVVSNNSYAHVNFDKTSTHKVKKNESISTILFQKKLLPLYGKSGTIEKTLKLNPHISKRKNYRIYPSEVVVLPVFIQKSKESAERTVADLNQESTENNMAVETEETNVIEESEDKEVATSPAQDNFTASTKFSAEVNLGWMSVSTQDESFFNSTEARVLSDTNYGLALKHELALDEKWSVYSKLNLNSISFQSNDTVDLSRKKFFTTDFSFGIQKFKNYSFDIQMKNYFYLSSLTSQKILISKILIPAIGASYNHKLPSFKKANFSGLVKGHILLPRSETGRKTKASYGLGYELQMDLLNQSYVLGYTLDQIKIESTSKNDTKSQNIYWGYIWRMKE